jgi:hypothetical protein
MEENLMATYLMIWEMNKALVPVDPKERGQGYSLLMGMVKTDKEKGILKAWGNFVGESSGFCLAEGSEVQISKMVQQYNPYVNFKTHPCASFEQTQEMINALMG